ncbi:hypothetical protein CEXT_590151 [Caerostris extrusa]|uniref:Uncharacterized protein n=1 Tax=Caerostris extrusa TaxID=172846 RepID=A0AAV4Y9J9_CAEEX|nr:hypothetical protein CEXT_590151 [Caerostris extrusa]
MSNGMFFEREGNEHILLPRMRAGHLSSHSQSPDSHRKVVLCHRVKVGEVKDLGERQKDVTGKKSQVTPEGTLST